MSVVSAQRGAALAGDDDGRGYDAGEHGEGVLEAEEEGEEDGHAVVEAKKRGGAFGFLHEGKVGFEEESIVVIADEAVPGGLLRGVREVMGAGGAFLLICEDSGETFCFFCSRFLRVGGWPKAIGFFHFCSSQVQ